MLDWSAPSARSARLPTPESSHGPVGTRARRSVPHSPGHLRDRGDRPAVSHRAGQCTPCPIAGLGDAQRPPRQNERIATHRSVVQRDRRDRQHVRRVVIEDEGVVESDGLDDPVVTTEPPFGGETLAVEATERRLDLRVRAQLPVLIITCLTNV